MIKIGYGVGKTEYGPGVSINMDGDDVATAIDAYLVAHDIHITGPRTITVNGELCEAGRVYVDPSGFVIQNGSKISGTAKRCLGCGLSWSGGYDYCNQCAVELRKHNQSLNPDGANSRAAG